MEIRLIAKGEETLCNDFQNSIYQKNRTLNQWQWEFQHNNHGRTPIPYAVVRDKDHIVGTQAFIPIRMIDRDGVYWTAKSEETLVHPDYRGQQLFEKMYAVLFGYAEQHGFASIWGFTPAVKAFVRLGFDVPGKTEQIFMPFSTRSIAAVFEKNLGGKKETATDKFKAAMLRSACVPAMTMSAMKVALKKEALPEGIEVRTMTTPDEQTADVCRRFIERWGGTTVYRDAGYLKWRLFDNPYVKGIVKGLYCRDKLLGWAAYTLGDDGLGYLIDLMVAGVDESFQIEKLVRALLLEAVIGTRNMGAAGVRGWHVNNHPFDKLVCGVARRVGFYHVKRGHAVVLYNCEAGKKRHSFDNFNHLYITRIFTEGALS